MTTEAGNNTENTSPQQTKREVLADEDGIRLDRWFKRHFPQLNHGQLQKWLRTGQIRLDGKRVEASIRLQGGQALRLPPALVNADPLPPSGHRAPSAQKIEWLKKMVIFQDKDVVVLNKPAGLAVQGGTGIRENLDDLLMVFSPDGETRPKLVHRLDKDTSGVLLVARNDFAAMKLTAAFRSHTTRKIYWALTKGVPKPAKGKIDAPLIKRGTFMDIAHPEEKKESKPAQTLYQVSECALKRLAFVVLSPLTGRTHQLRVHLAHLGTPVFGDPLYQTEENPDNPVDFSGLELGRGLHLHARRLIIPHPRRGVVDVIAPLQGEMKKSWKCLDFAEDDSIDFEER